MRISDWSSDVCSSDLPTLHPTQQDANADRPPRPLNDGLILMLVWLQQHGRGLRAIAEIVVSACRNAVRRLLDSPPPNAGDLVQRDRSEEHTSELQSLMRISYAVFCLKKKKNTISQSTHTNHMPIVSST